MKDGSASPTSSVTSSLRASATKVGSSPRTSETAAGSAIGLVADFGFEDRRNRVADPPRPHDVVGADDAAPPRHAERGGRKRRRAALVDLQVEESPEEGLVRRRQEQGVT